ncbi:TonB-dependent receptor [Bacteroidota bacterium]
MGNRISIPFLESCRNISLIMKGNIEIHPVQSVPEILTYVPGVDIRQRGPMGVQSDIGIRGGTFEQTLILVNGVKMIDPQTGHHSLNLPMNFDNIERIEVLKGPGTRIYGQNAFSGAVNFITGIPDKALNVNIYGGDFGLYGGSLSLSLPLKTYNQYISVSRNASNGYRHNSGYSINNIFYQSSIDIGGGELNFLGGYTDRAFGANGFYASPDYSEQYEEVQTGFVSMGYKKESGGFMYNPRIYWRNNSDNYSFIRDMPEVYKNLHTTNVAGLELNSNWENSLGISGFGVEFRTERINGDWIRGGIPTKSNLDGFYRKILGVFAEHKFKFADKWDLTPGIYLSNYTEFGWNYFPGIDIGYSLNEFIRLYGNIGKSYRVPNFYEMYYESPVEMGNPDLQPEEAITYEIGTRITRKGYSIEANVFIQVADNLIDWLFKPVTDSTSIWVSENITSLVRKGLETAIILDLPVMLDGEYWINTMHVSYNFINSGLQENEYQSRYVLENLKHQLIMGIDHKIFKKLFHNFKVRYNQRENKDSYWIIDSRIYWKQNDNIIIYAEATNLTDTEYVEVMTPMPGRWFRAGLKYHFPFHK